MKANSIFYLCWTLGSLGRPRISITPRVESSDHGVASYSLRIGGEITVKSLDDLELQVRLDQQTFGERSFLIEFKLVDPMMVPKVLEIANKTHSYEVGDEIEKWLDFL